MLFYTYLLLLLQPSVLWLSIVTFNNGAKPPQSEFCENLMYHESDPGQAGYPTLKRLHGKIWPRLRGLPGLAVRDTRLGGSPHLSCKRDQIKTRDYMDRRVTPPKRVTSPTWGPPPPYKRALSVRCWGVIRQLKQRRRPRQRKRYPKSKFALLQTSSLIF